jgi:hypothetical protein
MRAVFMLAGLLLLPKPGIPGTVAAGAATSRPPNIIFAPHDKMGLSHATRIRRLQGVVNDATLFHAWRPIVNSKWSSFQSTNGKSIGNIAALWKSQNT